MSELPPDVRGVLILVHALLRPVFPASLRTAIAELFPVWMQDWPAEVKKPSAIEVIKIVRQFEDDPSFRHWICEQAPLEMLLVIEGGFSLLQEWVKTRKPGGQELEAFQRMLLQAPSAVFLVLHGLLLHSAAETLPPDASANN